VPVSQQPQGQNPTELGCVPFAQPPRGYGSLWTPQYPVRGGEADHNITIHIFATQGDDRAPAPVAPWAHCCGCHCFTQWLVQLLVWWLVQWLAHAAIVQYSLVQLLMYVAIGALVGAPVGALRGAVVAATAPGTWWQGQHGWLGAVQPCVHTLGGCGRAVSGHQLCCHPEGAPTWPHLWGHSCVA